MIVAIIQTNHLAVVTTAVQIDSNVVQDTVSHSVNIVMVFETV